MKIRDFLKRTYSIGEYGFQETRPRIMCRDGFSMSVQAGEGMYCLPKENLKSGNYKYCEVGYPSESEVVLEPYDEGHGVFVYVPIEIIDRIIQKHGGFAEEMEEVGHDEG